jgi:serpin B
LYLVNTIYFKDNWKTSFEKDATREQVFYALSGQSKKVPMMHKELKVEYAENTKLQSIKLPYKNGGSMVIYLPKEGVDFKEFISKLSEEDLNLNYVSVKVSVSLPKFKIDKQTDVIPLFKELGVNEIFNKRTHDLSAITGIDAYVDKIAHRAVVEIDEEGTEAAAAAAIRVVERGMAPKPRIFEANRPFLFFITQGDFIGIYTGDE